MDETVSVARRLRDRDLQTAAVLVDFQRRSVIKASFDGAVVPKDFDRVIGYYHQHYRDYIDQLLKDNNLELSQDRSQTDNTN
jgi:hypothetical protein